MKPSRPQAGRLLPASLLLALALAGCAGRWPEALHGERPPAAIEAYYLSLARLSPGEFARERSELAAQSGPDNQLRLAMLLGHPRQQPPELARAITLLEQVGRTAAATPGQRAQARLLIDNYNERLRQEAALERQAVQIRDSQKKVAELQEKLDALAEIERTLPAASRAQPGTRQGGTR